MYLAQVTFDIHVVTWDPARGEWVDDAPTPAGTPLEDLQLEFTMLDPHVRTTVFPVKGKKGWYSISFRVPDRHGVFKFIIDWRRKGCVLYFSPSYSQLRPLDRLMRSTLLDLISKGRLRKLSRCCVSSQRICADEPFHISE